MTKDDLGDDAMEVGEKGADTTRVESIISQVSEIVTEATGRKVSDVDEKLSEYGLGSISLLDVFAIVESRFQIELTENVLAEFHTVRSIARVVKSSLRDATN